MKISLIAFTKEGRETGLRLVKGLEESGHECIAQALSENRGMSLDGFTEKAFRESNALVFICATGIAVRAIAPYIKDKTVDPAVVVIDDRGSFAISLLSGHLGGANKLARQAAAVLGACPVITTATDGGGVFSVDEWAKGQGLSIASMSLAKSVSAALLDGETVGFESDFSVKGGLPPGLSAEGKHRLTIKISHRREEAAFEPAPKGALPDSVPKRNVLYLIPRSVVLGIGCRKNTSAGQIEEAVVRTLAQHGIDRRSILCAASIDLKKREPGLLTFCAGRSLELKTYTARELMNAEGEFASSAFVQHTTGADNVCERAAVLASMGGPLLIGKTSCGSVTVAAAQRDIPLAFSK